MCERGNQKHLWTIPPSSLAAEGARNGSGRGGLREELCLLCGAFPGDQLCLALSTTSVVLVNLAGHLCLGFCSLVAKNPLEQEHREVGAR